MLFTVTGKMAQTLNLMLRFPQWLMSLAAFKSQQIMLASTMTKIFAVFIVGIPLCLVGGVLYSWTSGKGLVNGFINAYGALYKIPGTLCQFFPGQQAAFDRLQACEYACADILALLQI